MTILKSEQLDYLSLEFGGNVAEKTNGTDKNLNASTQEIYNNNDTTQNNLDVSTPTIPNNLSSNSLNSATSNTSSPAVTSFTHSRCKFKNMSDANDSQQYLALKSRFMWFRNNIQSVTFTFLFVALNCGFGLARVYQYRDTNILHIGARVCGQCLNLDCALLLGLILRRSITRIRNSPIGNFLPCDRHIHFHKMAGWTVLVLSILHTIFHLANFAGMSEETGIGLWTYLWDTSLGIGWLWGLANPTGVFLILILVIIAAFSHRCVRKSGKFEIFYWTHLLSLPFWALLVIHGPSFWKWLLLPGTIFLLENLVRLYQVCSPRGRTVIASSYSFGSQVTKLCIRKPRDLEFRAGEYVYLNIPSVAKYEWHPFTISSAPEEEDIFMVHIRAVGGWTQKVYELFHTRSVVEEPHKANFPLELPKREQKLSMQGILNLGFEQDDGLWKLKGPRYAENLKEFNRKTSSSLYPYKSIFDDKTKEGNLERKKSISLGSLSKYSEKSWSGQTTPESGSSSLTGSYSSIQGQALEIQGEPVVFPSVITLEGVGSQKKHLTPSEAAKNESCKVWIDQTVQGTTHGQREEVVSISKPIEVYVDGPYGSPSSNIFRVNHAVLIGAGIGVTPFASILQSVMHRYREAKRPCPHCKVASCVALPTTLGKLRKVDFIWVNRDLRHFEWFLELLASLEEEQSVPGAAMERLLTLHLYKTGREPLQFPIPLASAIHEGRPDWDKLLSSIRESRSGKVCVYYCGPPALAAVLREKCLYNHLDFRKEMF